MKGHQLLEAAASKNTSSLPMSYAFTSLSRTTQS